MTTWLSEKTLNRLCREILKTGALELRKVPPKVTNEQVETLPREEQPFLYSSGYWGFGYLMIKGLVSNKPLIRELGRYLAVAVAERWSNSIDFVAGNVTGGMIPGWLVSEELSVLYGRDVPFVYIRDTRKKGGHKELITGNLPAAGSFGLDMEELVNFAETTINGGGALREAGYKCNAAACILYYDNPVANQHLAEANMEMTALITLPRLLLVAEETGLYSQALLEEYRRYLANPLQWQADRGLTRVEKGGTK